ncbi:DUF6599 family protein [Candidatus Neomarinimicrobiota bacterium]
MKIYRFWLLIPLVIQVTTHGCGAKLPHSLPEDAPFGVVEGWGSPRHIERYTPDDVFNYINGASEFYLSYGFQELWTAEYTGSSESSLMVEVYRHQTPVDAFGIYTQERSSFADIVEVGIQGYCEAPILNFLKGSWYVKINGYGEQAMDPDNLQVMAHAIADQLGGPESWPAILAAFPEAGKMENSETYVAKDYLGYSFFPSAFQCEYTSAAGDFRIFIIDCGVSSARREVLEQYQPLTVSNTKIDEGRYMISDPYHGLIALQWTGSYIWGVLDTDDEELAIAYLEQTAAGIEAHSDR